MSWNITCYCSDEGISKTSVYVYSIGATYSGSFGSSSLGDYEEFTVGGLYDSWTVQFTATPADGYKFTRWVYRIGSVTADVQYSYDNPFTYSSAEDIYIRAESDSSGGGSTGGDSGSDDVSSIIEKYCGAGIGYTDTKVSPDGLPYIYFYVESELAEKIDPFDFYCFVSSEDTNYVYWSYLKSDGIYEDWSDVKSNWFYASAGWLDGGDIYVYLCDLPVGVYTVYIWFYDAETSDSLYDFEKTIEITSISYIAPWSWEASNGIATAAQTQLAGSAVSGKGYTGNFSYLVWNDMVDKVDDILYALQDSWTPIYLSLDETKMSESDKSLTADRFNSLRLNIGSRYATGISEKSAGEVVYGGYFTTLTDCINAWIGSIS